MELKTQLKKDMIDALKAGDQLKRTVLGMLMSSIKNKELNKRGRLASTITDVTKLDEASQLNDDEVLDVIAGEVKKRKDSVEQFQAGGREDLARQEQAEMEVLMDYLPVQVSEEEIKKEVQAAMAQTGAKEIKEIGKVIGLVMAKLKGRVDGSLVSKLVKEALS